MLSLRADAENGFTAVIGIGGIGAGIVYALKGEHELGRNESRLGELLDSRDYCKLHIVEHYIARLMGSGGDPDSLRVWPIGVVGNDKTGKELLSEMRAVGMDTRFVRRDSVLKTMFSVCLVYPDGSGGNITSSNSAAASLNASDLEAAAPYMRAAGARGVALCLPEVPLEFRRGFLTLASECGNYCVCSFALGEMEEAKRKRLVSQADLLALNQEEASALFESRSCHILNVGLLTRCAEEFTAARRGLRIVISAGSRGAYGFEGGRSQFCPAPLLEPVSTAGAGDALLAGILCGLAAAIPFIEPDGHGESFSGRVLRTALEFGVLNASFSVTSVHTIHPDVTLRNLLEFAGSCGASLPESLEIVSNEAIERPWRVGRAPRRGRQGSRDAP